jgi:hypothetical protein
MQCTEAAKRKSGNAARRSAHILSELEKIKECLRLFPEPEHLRATNHTVSALPQQLLESNKPLASSTAERWPSG